MVHGFRGDHHGLELVVDQLPGYRVIAPDLPGFGESEPLAAGSHDVDGYIRFLDRLAGELGLGPQTYLLGHSFGSIVVSHYLAAHPGRFRAAILVNPISEPALQGPKAVASRLAGFYYWAGAKLPERLGFGLLRNRIIVRAMSIMMAKTRDPQLRSYIHAQHDAYFSAFANRRVVLEAFRASISADVAQVADRLDLPVLLIAGERDDIGSVPSQRKLAAAIPDARLEVIPAVGHLIHYETPAPAAAYIRNFIDGMSA
ncbi:alpha/beta hydrolase [Arthrobacter sp. CAU 1506]|nr:alpha/beta hydrolase [Arthrobacter sp. CAU 1506]